MLFREPRRRRQPGRQSSGISSVESCEDRLLLSAASLATPDATDPALQVTDATVGKLSGGQAGDSAGRQYASIDGNGNNLDNPHFGSAHTPLLRLADAGYDNGLWTPAGQDRPSAREISNVIAAAEASETNSRYLTDIFWMWGQFIDHDLGLTETALDEYGNPLESFPIEVPAGDYFFDPLGTGEAVISLNRSVFAEGSDGVREQMNQITAFLDGSVIYGSDAERAAELRSFTGGLLKTSAGNLLPYNEAGLENAGGTFDWLFLAGDIRANENVALTAMHTIWVREHNRIAANLAAENPQLTDEDLYQQARQIVAGELQAITYNEFLPALFGIDAVSEYSGYAPSVDPGIATEFSTAAYRFGHTLLSSELLRLNEGGNIADEGNLALQHAFFSPGELEANGVDSILRGATVNVAQELDNQVVDDIRNFLFGPPGAGGFDLASLNIQRGRDHGLADYNSTRVALGLAAAESFSEITSDPAVASRLQQLYGTVNSIDLWVGGLAEDHLPGSSMGQTFATIIIDQFERLRDGDRFWYQNVFSGNQLAEIHATTLADVIERNTNITGLQQTVFFAPTVLKIDLAEVGANGITVRAVDGNLEVVRHGSGRLISSHPLGDIERVMLVGQNGRSDRIVVQGLSSADLPGGMSIDCGSDPGDMLICIGTRAADTFVVSNQTVAVNGLNMEVAGVSRVIIAAARDVDTVEIGDGNSFRVSVIDLSRIRRLFERWNDRDDDERGRRKDQRCQNDAAPGSDVSRERRREPAAKPRQSAAIGRSSAAVAISEGNLGRALTILDQLFAGPTPQLPVV